MSESKQCQGNYPEEEKKLNSVESAESPKYLGTSKAELDHYFNNHIGIILLLFQLRKEKPEEVEKNRFEGSINKFITGLKLTLARIEDGVLKETDGVDSAIIKEFILLAEEIKDPSSEEEIKPIIEKYSRFNHF